jgi:hypothetical protein
MRRVFSHCLALLMLVALAAISPGAIAEDVRFLSVIEDLPLMAGLDEDTDAAMTFDSAQGRIVEANAAGRVGADKVRAFYAATLLALGWQGSAEGQFTRGGEILSLEIKPAGKGAVSVRFALRPGAR